MTNDTLMYIGIGLMICALSLMTFLIIHGRKHRDDRADQNNIAKAMKSAQAYRKSRYGKGNLMPDAFWLWLYQKMSAGVLTRRSIYHIRSRIEILGTYDEGSIRLKVIKIYGILQFILLAVLLSVVAISRNVMTVGLWMVILWVVSESLIDFLVVRLKNRLLWQQIKFNETVRHKYYQSGMVDEAIYETCGELDRRHYEISLQGERMVDILMSRDPQKAMMNYNDVAPNKYLKMFLSLAYMTMEYGDTYLDGVSVFMKNLHDLTGELRLELTKRERLNYALRSLNVIVLLPLLLIGPVKEWASSYFMPLKLFYESQTGFLLQMIMTVMILACYILLRKVQQFDKGQVYRTGRAGIEEGVYLRIPIITKLVDWRINRMNRIYLMKLKQSINMTGVRLNVEGFVLRQWFMGLVAALVSLCVLLYMHHAGRLEILAHPTVEQTFLGGKLTEEELAKAVEVTDRDNRYLAVIDRHTDYDQIVQLLADDGFMPEEAAIVAKQIQDKQLRFYNHRLKLWELALVIAAGGLGSQIPKLMLSFGKRLMRMEVEDEVTGFGTIVLMLMHHERLAVSDILEWFELYANAFSKPISDCLNNLASGMTEALEVLKISSDNEQFTGIVEGLILASQDITIRQAFDELDSEKTYHMEQRKENNRRIVEKKVNLGNMIGFLPVYGLIVIYMIIPMVVISMRDMSGYFEQISL